jgi:hypothetical protein
MKQYLFVQLALGCLAGGCSAQGDANDAGVPVDAVSADSGEAGAPACDPSTCASGHCALDGGCAHTCTSPGPCASPETCCDNTFCTDVTKDPQNCGSCGNACTASQFCSGVSCNAALVMNLCQNASGVVVMDGIAIDQAADSVVDDAITPVCPSMDLVTISQGSAGSIDPSSGRPLLGPGSTYIAAGGAFGQKAVNYMNGTHNAPVYTTDDGQSVSFLRTADNSTIVSAPTASLTAHHDYFLVYVAVEPISDTLVFAVYGLYGPGTAAGAYWFTTQAMSGLQGLAKQYYVYEWTDTNNDGVPNAADTFTLLASN